jgi:hypothetical protein
MKKSDDLLNEPLITGQIDDPHDLNTLWLDLRLFFGSSDTMLQEWIATPLPILGGQEPRSIMQTGDGRNQIRNCIQKMRDGDF